MRLKKGLVPLCIEYFQGNGDKRLELYYQRVASPADIALEDLQPLSASQLVHAKEN